MNPKVVDYIHKHPHIYRILRDESFHYKLLFENESYIYELNKIAKEKYHIRYTDKLDNISDKINILNAFLDVFK